MVAFNTAALIGLSTLAIANPPIPLTTAVLLGLLGAICISGWIGCISRAIEVYDEQKRTKTR
jgi:hypothetical protein